MPSLAIIAACEKVIIDHSGIPSLIGIFQRINVVRLEGLPFPDNAVAPNNWAVFTLWQHSDEELHIPFEQHIEIITPDGKTFAESKAPFVITEQNDGQSNHTMPLQGVPVWAEGPVTINTWLAGHEDEKHTFVFWIAYVDSPPVPYLIPAKEVVQ